MIEIGRSKRAQQVYSFDDIAIVPTRRTRHIEDVRLNWTIDALTFDFPIVAAPQDSVMSPATASFRVGLTLDCASSLAQVRLPSRMSP